MKRGREVNSVLMSEPEHIGHITTPIEGKQAARILAILKKHDVTVFTCQGNDNWWTLVMPASTTQTLQRIEGNVPCSLVCLPDGFTFVYEPPVLNRDGTYMQYPRIIVEEMA